MKIVIDEGHNRGQDQGAEAIGNENIMNMQTGEKVIAKLQALGHKVLRAIDCVPQSVDVGTSLYIRASAANSWGADLYVSIHSNAGGGNGTEVWIGSEKSRDIAVRIVNNISSLGYASRGVKVQGIDGPNLYVLKNTNMPALLIEQCFIDSKKDILGFNPDSMADAIVAGITEQPFSAELTVESEDKSKAQSTPKYDESIPRGANIFTIPNTKGYIEQTSDGRLLIHRDRGNYIAIGKGSIQAFWNDNNGHSGSKEISG